MELEWINRKTAWWYICGQWDLVCFLHSRPFVLNSETRISLRYLFHPYSSQNHSSSSPLSTRLKTPRKYFRSHKSSPSLPLYELPCWDHHFRHHRASLTSPTLFSALSKMESHLFFHNTLGSMSSLLHISFLTFSSFPFPFTFTCCALAQGVVFSSDLYLSMALCLINTASRSGHSPNPASLQGGWERVRKWGERNSEI